MCRFIPALSVTDHARIDYLEPLGANSPDWLVIVPSVPEKGPENDTTKVTFRLEDVKKLIMRSFRDFSFETKCMPTSQRSPLGHPGAAFFDAEFSQWLKINFFTSSCPP